LCINYTNEHLQHHFNDFVFTSEQKFYTEQCIQWEFITFPDNQEVLDLLEKKRTGLFALCDEQVKFPKASNKTLLRKFYEHCRAHPRFYVGNSEEARDEFVVKHFAGPVKYSSANFLEKTYVVVNPDMAFLLQISRYPLVAQLYDFCRVDVSAAGGVGGAGRKIAKIFTLGGEFRRQLDELMRNIKDTTPHYIRCQKPNAENVQSNFNPNLVIEQLRCNGVLEAVRVSRSEYPNRFTLEQFGKRYRGVCHASSVSKPWALIMLINFAESWPLRYPWILNLCPLEMR
jgi:myosin V